MALVLQYLDSPHQQVFLLAVAGFKACFVGVDSNQARRARAVLMVARAKSEYEPMRLGLSTTVKVMHAHIEVADAVDTTRHAANVLAQRIVEPLLSGRGRFAFHAHTRKGISQKMAQPLPRKAQQTARTKARAAR